MGTQAHSIEDLKPGTSSWLSTRKAVCQVLEEQGCFVGWQQDFFGAPQQNLWYDRIVV